MDGVFPCTKMRLFLQPWAQRFVLWSTLLLIALAVGADAVAQIPSGGYNAFNGPPGGGAPARERRMEGPVPARR